MDERSGNLCPGQFDGTGPAVHAAGSVVLTEDERSDRFVRSWLKLQATADGVRDDLDDVALHIEILAGYLAVASEDAAALAEAMSRPYVNLQEVTLMAEQAAVSTARFRRARMWWLERCAV